MGGYFPGAVKCKAEIPLMQILHGFSHRHENGVIRQKIDIRVGMQGQARLSAFGGFASVSPRFHAYFQRGVMFDMLLGRIALEFLP